MDPSRRRYERFRVHLRVRFSKADDFVVQYAENLSYGGLFIKGVDTLGQLEEVVLDLELPGHGNYRVKGMVAHVVAPEMAKSSGRDVGVGIQLMEEPAEFRRALNQYLAVLGARRDSSVLVCEHVWSTDVVQDGGYNAVLVRRVTLDGVVGEARHLLALVCSRDMVDEYRAGLGAAGAALPIVEADADLDAVLARLDEILKQRV